MLNRMENGIIGFGIFICVIAALLLGFAAGTDQGIDIDCPEKQRADSLQKLLWQCGECCTQNNAELMQMNKDMARWHAWKDSTVGAMYNRMLTK